MYIKVDSVIINNDELNTYSFDKLNNNNEIINLLKIIENDYGKINELSVLKINNNKLIDNRIFNNLNEFINNNIDIMNYNIINFSILNKNIVFTLDIKAKKISINNLGNTLGTKEYDNSKIRYFKNGKNQIIKFDGNTSSYYFLNNEDKWEKHNSLISQFYNSEYNLHEIYYDEVKKAL